MKGKRTVRAARLRRHERVRERVVGTPQRPRLCVFRSLKHIYAQIIDDQAGRTLVAASDLETDLRLPTDGKKPARSKKAVSHPFVAPQAGGAHRPLALHLYRLPAFPALPALRRTLSP